MLTLDTMTEADIGRFFRKKSLSRGRGYQSRVDNARRQGDQLQATVRGTRRYEVEIQVTDGTVHARCSCPYDWGGYCKHIAATFYQWVRSPEAFAVQKAAVAEPTSDPAPIDTFPIDPPATKQPQEKPDWLQASFQQRQHQYRQQISSSLVEHLKVQEMRQMAKKQGWSLSGTRKDGLAEQITDYLLQPESADSRVAALDSEHRHVFQALLLIAPQLTNQTILVEKIARQWGPLQQYKKIGTYLSHLQEAGLALPGPYDYAGGTNPIQVPHRLAQILPPVLAGVVPEATLPADKQSDLTLTNPLDFIRTANQVMLLLEQSAPPLRQPQPRPQLENFYDILKQWAYLPEEIQQANRAHKFQRHDPEFSLTVPPPQPPLPAATMEKLAAIVGDADQLAFLYHLLVTTGLLQPGSPVTVWAEVKEQFLRHSEVEQGAILLQSYMDMTNWSELWLALRQRPSLRLKRLGLSHYRYFTPSQLYRQLQNFRLVVLRVLACLPEEQWIALPTLRQLLQPLWDRFDYTAWERGHYGNVTPRWFLEKEGQRLETHQDKAAWHIAQGGFIRTMLEGPLAWLGVADLSHAYGDLVAFRLHGLADIYWDRREALPLADVARATAVAAPAPTAPDAITVTGHTITVNPTTISAQAHNYLDNIAILQEATPGRFVYQLSAAAIHEAFEAGQTVDQLLDGWETYLPLPLPDPIATQIRTWWDNYGRIRLYENVTVIEFGDAYALREMRATTSLDDHIIAEISPTLILIPETAVAPLVAELEQAGYTPKQTDEVR